MQHIAIIDYGGSNLRSVAKAIESVAEPDQHVSVTNSPQTIRSADRVVFPGQGAIGDCMASLKALDLIGAITEAIHARPFLGICLGLQSLLTNSEEDGGTVCLNLYPGHVRRFTASPPPAADGTPQKIPHMGWNQVHWSHHHPLIEGIPSGSRFYFVHSYYVVPEDPRLAIGNTDYIDPFVSALAEGTAFATQFHPEKSAEHGLRLLRNFLRWDGSV